VAEIVEPKKKPIMSFKKANFNVLIHFGSGDFTKISPCGSGRNDDLTTDDWDYVTCGDCFKAKEKD
jgi:hypothetical protein